MLQMRKCTADYYYLYYLVLVMCCRGKEAVRGKPIVEAFKKIQVPDKNRQGGLKGVGGSYGWDPKRYLNNVRESHCPLPKNSEEFTRLMKGELAEYAQKQILKSQYEQLLEQYKNSNKLWTDPDFPPNDRSWGSSKGRVVWKRVSEIIKNPQFVSDNFTPGDILQGSIGNCYFLSAIAGLAERPYRIKKLFPNTTLNKNGIYMARLLHKGVYQEVVVDDFFPCSQNGELLGAQPACGNQIWVMILEKCWAKLFNSYDIIDGGLPNEVLHAFSAAPTYNYSVANYRDRLDELFEKMLQADKRDQIVCCGTQPQNYQGKLQKVGLVGGHAYTILGVYEYPVRMLKIRNPWGNMQWRGTASDSDRRFWQRINIEDQMTLGYTNKDDGTFFMLWQDFEQFFVVVDICWINDNANYFYQEDKFQKGLARYYDFDTMGGDLTVALSQPSRRERKAQGDRSPRLAHTTLVMGRELPNKDFEYVMSKSGTSYADLYLKIKNLESGRYMICGFVDGEKPIKSTMSVYSGVNIALINAQKKNQDFLNKCYLDHARKNQFGRQVLIPRPLEWVAFDLLTDSCGFGYSAFHLDSGAKRKLGLQFDERQYTDNGLELLQPYKGEGTFKIIVCPGQQAIVLCRLSPNAYYREFMMPVPKMFRLR